MGSPALLVRLREPEPLVHAPGDLGEDIGAVRVLELVHLFDADPSRAAECGERVRQRGHVLRTRCKHERIIEEGDRSATTPTVPSAMPPSCTIRSAIRSTYASTSSLISSNNLCSAMNVGPFTFQWACLHCVCRSMQSASRWLSRATASPRAASGRSFFVGYAAVAARERFSGALWREPASSRRGVVVRVIGLS